MNKEKIVTEIKSSFKQNEYPGDDNIVYDNSKEHDDCFEVRRYFQGKKWDEISNDFLFKIKHGTTFFSSKGLHYYLPSFMLFILNDFNGADVLVDNIISELTLPIEIDTVIMANAIKKFKTDEKMPEIDFEYILNQQLESNNDRVKSFIGFTSLFTNEQGLSVKSFLEYLIKNHGSDYQYGLVNPQIALDRYWFVFK